MPLTDLEKMLFEMDDNVNESVPVANAALQPIAIQ